MGWATARRAEAKGKAMAEDGDEAESEADWTRYIFGLYFMGNAASRMEVRPRRSGRGKWDGCGMAHVKSPQKWAWNKSGRTCLSFAALIASAAGCLLQFGAYDAYQSINPSTGRLVAALGHGEGGGDCRRVRDSPGRQQDDGDRRGMSDATCQMRADIGASRHPSGARGRATDAVTCAYRRWGRPGGL